MFSVLFALCSRSWHICTSETLRHCRWQSFLPLLPGRNTEKQLHDTRKINSDDKTLLYLRLVFVIVTKRARLNVSDRILICVVMHISRLPTITHNCAHSHTLNAALTFISVTNISFLLHCGANLFWNLCVFEFEWGIWRETGSEKGEREVSYADHISPACTFNTLCMAGPCYKSYG